MLAAVGLLSWYLFRLFSKNARWNSNPVIVMIILLIGNAITVLTGDWGGDLVYTD